MSIVRKMNGYAKGGGVSTIAGIKLSESEMNHVNSLVPEARKAALHQIIGYQAPHINPTPGTPEWAQNNSAFNAAVSRANGAFNPGLNRAAASADAQNADTALKAQLNANVQNQKMQNLSDVSADAQQKFIQNNVRATALDPLSGYKKGGLVSKLCMGGKIKGYDDGGVVPDWLTQQDTDNKTGGSQGASALNPQQLLGGKMNPLQMGAGLVGGTLDTVNGAIGQRSQSKLNQDYLQGSPTLQKNFAFNQQVGQVQGRVENTLMASGNPIAMGVGLASKVGRAADGAINNAATNQYGEYKSKSSEIFGGFGKSLNGMGTTANAIKDLGNRDLTTGDKILGFTGIGAAMEQNKIAKIEHKKYNDRMTSNATQQAAATRADQRANAEAVQDASVLQNGYAAGGKISGPGTGKSDSIPATVKPGSFIVPAVNAGLASKLRAKYLGNGGKAPLKDGSVNVRLSNGEHMFTPEEVAQLTAKGVDLNALAPNAEHDSKLSHGGIVMMLHGNSFNPIPTTQVAVREIFSHKNKNFGKVNFADGGKVDPIHIKPANKGKFTEYKKRTGKTTEEALHSKDPHVRKMANFAKNAKNFNHKADGGVVNSSETGGPVGSDNKKYPGYAKGGLVNGYADGGSPVKKHLQISSDTYLDQDTGNIVKLSQEKNGIIKKSVIGKATEGQNNYSPGRKVWLYNGKYYDNKNTKEINANLDKVVSDNNNAYTNKNPKVSLPVVRNQSVLASKVPVPQAAPVSKTMPRKFAGNGKSPGIVPTGASSIALPNDPLDTTETVTNAPKTQTPTNDDIIGPASDEPQLADSKALAASINTGNGTDKVTDKELDNKIGSHRAIDDLGGPAGVLGLGQAGIGLVGLLNQGKRPQYVIGGDTQQDLAQAEQQANYGYSDAQKNAIRNDIEDTRRADVGNILNLSNDAGTSLANIRAAGVGANKSLLQMGADDAQLQLQKRMFKSGLVNQMENRRRQQFEDKLQKFKENQAAYADLLNAGISNTAGAIQSQKYGANLNAIDSNGNPIKILQAKKPQ